MAISTWFWSSGFGPRPSVGIGPAVASNGLAGPSIRAKKKAATTRPTSVAQATSGSDGPGPQPAHGHRQVAGQHQRPQQDRALQRPPQGGHRVEQGRGPGVVPDHVVDGEVVADEGPLHGPGGHDRAGQAPGRRTAGRWPGGGRRCRRSPTARVTTPRTAAMNPRVIPANPRAPFTARPSPRRLSRLTASTGAAGTRSRA